MKRLLILFICLMFTRVAIANPLFLLAGSQFATASGGYVPGPNEVVCIVDTDTSNEEAHYHSLQAAITGESGATPLCATSVNLAANSEQLTFLMKASTGVADTTAVNIGATTFTTSTDYFIRIVADPAHKHAGVWDNSKYRLEVPASAVAGIRIDSQHYIIDGLQIKRTTDYSNRYAVDTQPGAAGFNILRNNIISGAPTASGLVGIRFSVSNTRAQVYNNLIFGFNYSSSGVALSIDGSGTIATVYNNTIYGNNVGINRSNGSATVRNNISVGNSTSDYNGTFVTASNNMSSDATAPGASSITSAVVKYSTDTLTAAAKSTDNWVIFQSSTDRNLVSAIDTLELNDAIGAGVDVSLDKDIADNDWATTPSIGAFELQ